MSNQPTSFHDFKWACGHTGPGYCKICRDEQVNRLQARVETLEVAMSIAKERPLVLTPTRVIYDREYYRKLKQALAATEQGE